MKKFSSAIIKILACVIVVAGMFWFDLPPVNLRSEAFWGFLVKSIIVCTVIICIGGVWGFIKRNIGGNRAHGKEIVADGKQAIKSAALPIKIVIFTVIGIILFSLLMSLIGARIFNARKYASLIETVDGNFATDVAELSMSQIPVVDRDTATRLGQRKLGEMSDLVSQFEIESDYTQINFNDRPTRVTPLKYADFIKWCTNTAEGVPAYITVDLTTQEADLVRLSDLGLGNIRYSRSEYFLRNVDRALRLKYPTKIFGSVSFEIDEQGTPFWVASVIQYKIGFWSGPDICGAVLMNATTGESNYYALQDIPQWVDQAYDENMLFQQLTDNGLLKNGYWNSVFGQKGCVMPTDGYNYLAIDDDVWMYTGITSVTADESNIGFVLVNLRTKEARYYVQAGAEEYSAMDSAKGQIQEKNYNATFPILLNVGGRPTYFMSLKDDAGLVKMYAFVDMEQYQIVGTGTTVDKAREAYIGALADEKIETDPNTETETIAQAQGVVTALASAVVDGNTQYYVKMDGVDGIVVLPASISNELPFLKVGDTLTVSYTNGKPTNITIG